MKAQTKEHDLLNFLDGNPTAWHAVEDASARFKRQGFEPLEETRSWSLKPGGKYFVVRHGRAFCAFVLPKKAPQGARIVGSHIDSPGFKLKPQAEYVKENMLMLGLEIYGAPLLASWLNRDLGIAGHVVYRTKSAALHSATLIVDDLAVVIPQIAIHLDRTVNENGLVVHKQEHLAAILACDSKPPKLGLLEKHLKKQLGATEIISSDLRLFPLEKARYVGGNHEMVSSYRIDSMAGVYAILEGFQVKPLEHDIQVAAFWDHEEIGSGTPYGAGSPFLMQTLERILGVLGQSRDAFYQFLARSTCLSVDLCHAIHPNYSDRHEPRHPMLMNQGIAIKHHAQFKYAGDAALIAHAVELCQKHKIPFQHFIPRGDIPSGSTIGPILAGLTGIRTLDVGISQLSMHSSRELMGVLDQKSLSKFIHAFLS